MSFSPVLPFRTRSTVPPGSFPRPSELQIVASRIRPMEWVLASLDFMAARLRTIPSANQRLNGTDIRSARKKSFQESRSH